MLLGQALVATENKAYTDEAITILRAAVAREIRGAARLIRQLAMAYGRKGDYAEADLASAQAAFLRGDNKTARELASRAKTRFAIGTPGWVKADDIVAAKPLPGQKTISQQRNRRHRPGFPTASTERICQCLRSACSFPRLLALALCGAPIAASAQSFSDTQRGDIETIVQNYLIAHPEVLEEAMNELSKRQAAADAAEA